MYVARDGLYKMVSTSSQSTSKQELYKMTLSFKGRVNLQNGVYEETGGGDFCGQLPGISPIFPATSVENAIL